MPRTSTYRIILVKCSVIVWLLHCSSTRSISQSTPATVQKIEIKGNQRSKTAYLERFIQLKPGDTFDSLKIANDLRRLRTLPGIQSIDYTMSAGDSGDVLTYSVTERYTFMPVGDFGVTENNFWIGGGAMESNLAGRGMYIYGFYRYDRNHTVHAIFRNPYIAGSRWGTELQLKRLPTRETANDTIGILNIVFDLSGAITYELRYENDFLAGLSYREQSYRTGSEEEASFADSHSSRRKSIVAFGSWEYSRLDYHNFYVSGWRNNVHVELVMPVSGPLRPIILIYDELRYFARIGYKGNFAARVFAGISNEDQTVFSPFIADSYYNFRGIGYRAARGNTIGLVNLEYRLTVYENKLGGIQALLFSDSGFLAKSTEGNESLSFHNSFHSFAGPGLRIIYKGAYNAILSVDYGVNLENYKEGGWVIGWGQYF